MTRFDAHQHQSATAGDWAEAAHSAYHRMKRMQQLADAQNIPVARVYNVTAMPVPGNAARLTPELLEVLVPCALADHGDHEWSVGALHDDGSSTGVKRPPYPDIRSGGAAAYWD